jgi:purine-cytosine permease-like protein
MRKYGLGKMPAWQRWFTISTLIICSISGIAFLMGHEFQISRQTLGAHSVLALHGIASALALIAFGAVMPFHIKAGLKAWKNLISGISQLLFLAILVITALLLYYGPEELHDGSKLVHWVLGLVFFIIFIFHISNRSIRR